MALRWNGSTVGSVYGYCPEFQRYAAAHVERINASEYIATVRTDGFEAPLLGYFGRGRAKLGPFATLEEAKTVAEVVFRMEGKHGL